MWNWLRARRFAGFKFRRQHPIGRYVVDFCSPTLSLVIEIDGNHHESAWAGEYDGVRTRFLHMRGFSVIRIPNHLVRNDPRTAIACIELAVSEHARLPR